MRSILSNRCSGCGILSAREVRGREVWLAEWRRGDAGASGGHREGHGGRHVEEGSEA